MEEKPKRRWRTFSIRTLLVAVTIFCVWLGWQVSIVRERQTLLDEIVENSGIIGSLAAGETPYSPSLLRRLLGDEEVPSAVFLEEMPSTHLQQRIETVLPEADIVFKPRGGDSEWHALRAGERSKWFIAHKKASQ